MSHDDGLPGSRVPYWRLIAVLTSNFPLSQALAMRLYRGAFALHRDGLEVEKISGDLGEGEVRRLGKDLVLGTLCGPGFEAQIEGESGRGRVRFVVTREGLEEGERSDEAQRRLMN